MNKTITYSIIITIVVLLMVNLLHREKPLNLSHYELKQEFAIKHTPSVDHSQFEILQTNFETPQEVTEACLSCHNQRHEEIIHSSHWNWDRVSYVEGKGISKMGKKNVMNNFCIGTTSNEKMCAKCHIGYGMTNNTFDFNNARNTDCMVCHDKSEKYKKALAGNPDRTVNLNEVAQSVGRPNNVNCGSCHFFGGGGNNVKHGDLENALLSCDRNTDVHMASNGMNMTCIDCHGDEKHQIKGKLYSVSSTNANRLRCEECHTSKPHLDDMVNRHSSKVACQTCHIPTYAKENSTKMSWKWSEAGKMDENGKPLDIVDSLGNHVYVAKKGEFVWERNVTPEYVWFNGNAKHVLLGDTISLEREPVQINELLGSADDINSKIYPVKVHRGNQPYDPNTKIIIQPKLFSKEKGDSAFWQSFDWHKAAEAGMRMADLPYSGEHTFIKTEMYWPINHMVAPKEQALSCEECHVRENSRLAALNNFYLPGRDSNEWIDLFGTLLLLGSLAGVFIHSLARYISSLKNN